MSDSLFGKRVLVVEDEPLIAMAIEDILEQAGAVTVGPAAEPEDACRLVESQPLDAAVLDLNLNGTLSYAIADLLKRRGIPYFFASGYGKSGLKEPHDRTPILAKPYRAEELTKMLKRVIERHLDDC